MQILNLTLGYEIDVYRDMDDMVDDVAIEEFSRKNRIYYNWLQQIY